MKKIILILLFLYNRSNIIFSQINLVPNPSFEILTSCIDSASQESPIELAYPWFNPTGGTPDLYHSCHKKISAQVPYNGYKGLNYQPAKTGFGYAGMISFNFNPGLMNDVKEYIEVELLQKTKKRHKYFVEFWVANNVNKYPDPKNCYSDGVGIALSEKKYLKTDFFIIDDLKQIAENKNGIINNSPVWNRVSTIYKNNESEMSFLVIGNFNNNSKIKYTDECKTYLSARTYLFIDDVAVYECDVLPDTILLCDGEKRKIGKRFLTSTYQWNTGATDSIITINKAGRYIVNMNYNSAIISDTTYVIDIKKTTDNILRDSFLCKGENIKITLPDIGEYIWEDKQNSNILEVKNGGLYAYTITTPCGTTPKILNIKEEDCSCNIYFPNVFSPNEDGVNDDLRYYSKCYFDLRITRFQIYDRWGNHVFLVENIINQNIDWDGTFRGEPLPQDVYTYSLEYEYTQKQKIIKQIKKGDFILVR